MGTTTILGIPHTTVDTPGGLTWTEDLKVPTWGAFVHPRGMMLYTPLQVHDTFLDVPGWRLPTHEELENTFTACALSAGTSPVSPWPGLPHRMKAAPPNWASDTDTPSTDEFGFSALESGTYTTGDGLDGYSWNPWLDLGTGAGTVSVLEFLPGSDEVYRYDLPLDSWAAGQFRAVRLVRDTGPAPVVPPSRVPLVQRVKPRKLPAGWRVTLTGYNFDLVLGAQFGALPLVTPAVQTARELVFILPGSATPGRYVITLEGEFGALQAPDVTVVELVDLDNYSPAALGSEEYGSHLLELLPKGPAWTRRPGTNLWKLLSACALELARIHTRAGDLLKELSPRFTVEAIPEWETELGLPEPLSEDPPTTEEGRRAEILRKFRSLGGCSAAYFEELAAILGSTIEVVEIYEDSRPFVAGRGLAGESLVQGAAMFSWKVRVPNETANPFLESILRGVAPRHTLVFFEYLGV